MIKKNYAKKVSASFKKTIQMIRRETKGNKPKKPATIIRKKFLKYLKNWKESYKEISKESNKENYKETNKETNKEGYKESNKESNKESYKQSTLYSKSCIKSSTC